MKQSQLSRWFSRTLWGITFTIFSETSQPPSQLYNPFYLLTSKSNASVRKVNYNKYSNN